MSGESTGNWSMEALDKAYDQGFLAGRLGMVAASCPYLSEVIVAAWEAGWADGRDACRKNFLVSA